MVRRNIWAISDTHLSHLNIIRYCHRPFQDEHEMDEAIIERWNAVVAPQDKVYHVGDVFFREGWKHLPRLNGHKRLILGNHDNGKCQHLNRFFEKIYCWRMFPEFGLLLTHVPVHEETLNVNKCPVNVHGHIHDRVVLKVGTKVPDERYRNVSVEQINYTPVNLEDLRVW